MSFPFYYPVVPISSVESPVSVVANPWDGYKWYQSHPSSEGMAASPLHYSVEYRPPEPPPLSPHGNSPDFTFNPYYYPTHMLPYAAPPPSPNLHTNCAPYMYTPPFTLPCQTTISTVQTYYTHESTAPVTTTTTIVDSPKLMDTPLKSATSVKGNQWEETLTKIMAILDRMQERCAVRSTVDDKTIQDEVVIGDGSRLGETVVEDEDNLQVDVLKSGEAVVGTVGRNDQADTSKLVKEAVEIQGKLIVDAIEVEPQVFDKSPVRNSDLVVETVCEDDWSNDDDSFIRMNLTIFQHSSPIMEYVTEYMLIKSRAEFKFQCDFEDPLLAYCFVEGLDEDIREALELWAPQTLQEAIYLATFQELWIDESSLVESIVRKSDETLVEDGLLVDNYGVEIDSDVLAIVSVGNKENRDESGNEGGVVDEEGVVVIVADAKKYFTATRMIPTTIIATILDDNCLNVDKKNFRNFDPGGVHRGKNLNILVVAGVTKVVEDGNIKKEEENSVKDVSASSDHPLHLEFLLLKNCATALIQPGFSSYKNTLYGYHKVLEVDTKIHNNEVSKSIQNGKDDQSEGITVILLETSSSLKWVEEYGNAKRNETGEENGVIEFVLCVNEGFSEGTRVGMIYGIEYTVVAWAFRLGTATIIFLYKLQHFIISWVFLMAIGLVNGYFEWERFNEALDLVVAMHTSSKIFNEASFTSTQGANVSLFDQILGHISSIRVQEYKDMLGRYKAHCKVSSMSNHVIVVNVPAAYQELITKDPINLSQALVLKLKSDPGHHNYTPPSDSACRWDLLNGRTPGFGDLAIHEHQHKRTFRFMHRQAHSKSINIFGGKLLSGALDGLIANGQAENAISKVNWFNAIDHKGTRLSSTTQALKLCVESGNSKKFGVSFFKILALSWYWSAITLVFDPGKSDRCQVYLKFDILEDKDVFKGKEL